MGISTSSKNVIDFNDFKSLQLIISIENLTSNTFVYENRRIYPSGKDNIIEEGHFPIIMSELLESGFILDLPARSCSVGHNLNVSVETRNLEVNYKFVFKVKAKILQESERTKQDNANQRQQFEFVLVAPDKDLWQSFQSIFEARQNEILDFFEAAKG